MAFDNLLPQMPPRNEQVRRYGEKVYALSRAVAEGSNVVMDVAYGEHPRQALDIYLPNVTSAGPLPVLAFFHGGAWCAGYKEWIGFLAPSIVALPAIYVAVSYRIAPEHKFPAALEDCVDSLAWMHANIATHGGDPGRIVLSGHSAGGSLAALTTLRSDALARRGLGPEIVRACLPVSATFDLRFSNDEELDGGAIRIRDLLFAKPEDAAKASAINYVAGNRVPFFVSYGSDDLARVIRTGERMVAALRAGGAPVEHQVFEGADHFQVNLDQRLAEHPWMRTAQAYLART